MDLRATLDATCSPATLFACVASLDGYDRWLEIVPRTEPDAPADGDPGPAWAVTLRGRLGPLARSKRLRMVRSVHDAPRRAVFERRETDGREHAAWVLTATVDPVAGSDVERSTLTMDLHYGGSLWVPLLDRLLAGEIEASRERLRSLVEDQEPGRGS